MTAYMLRKDRIVLKIYSPTLSQSTNTLIPGRMRRTSSMGRAFTAKVRMSKLPCVPCREIGLHRYVGHFQLDVAVEGGHVTRHARADLYARQHGLLDVERHPHVRRVEYGDDGITRAHQFALLGDDGRHLAVDGRIYHGVADVRLHLAHRALGLKHLSGRGFFLLLACAVQREVVLGFGGHLGGLHGAVVGLGLVVFLRGNHTLLIQGLHAFESLLGELLAGLCLLPHVQRGLFLGLARSGQSLLVHRGGRAFHRFGLTQFGVQLGCREHVKQFAFGHLLSLLDLHLLDAARYLRRCLVTRALHCALNYRGFRFFEVIPYRRYCRYYHYQCDNEPNDIAFFHDSIMSL